MKLTKRIIASRANGRLSHGPKTEEGKKRWSANSLRHGLLSKCVLLPNESCEGFEALVDAYTARLAPSDGVDYAHIEEMAVAVWRMRRLWATETRLWTDAISKRKEPDPMDRIAFAFRDLAQGNEFDLLCRYEGKFQRAYQRALTNFLAFDALENRPTDAPPPRVNRAIQAARVVIRRELPDAH